MSLIKMTEEEFREKFFPIKRDTVNIIPMKKYIYTIMSIDPKEDPEDNHQKYAGEVEAEDHWKAEGNAKADFLSQHPDLPIYWVKVVEK